MGASIMASNSEWVPLRRPPKSRAPSSKWRMLWPATSGPRSASIPTSRAATRGKPSSTMNFPADGRDRRFRSVAKATGPQRSTALPKPSTSHPVYTAGLPAWVVQRSYFDPRPRAPMATAAFSRRTISTPRLALWGSWGGGSPSCRRPIARQPFLEVGSSVRCASRRQRSGGISRYGAGAFRGHREP